MFSAPPPIRNKGKPMRPVLPLLLMLMTALPVAADPAPRPPTGLMWNRSGLPMTIPFQLRTPAGRDHAVLMTDPASGEVRVAGYVRGGDFFRLLMPPGDYLLRIAAGPSDDWQGQEGLFGDATVWAGLDQVLRFRINANRRLGYQITLAERDGALVITDHRDQVICHIARWEAETVREAVPNHDGPGWRYLDFTLKTRSRFCD